MKSLLKVLGLSLLTLGIVIIIVLIFSISNPQSPVEPLKVGARQTMVPVVITAAAFSLLILLIAFKQGVDKNPIAAMGAFAIGQILMWFTFDRFFGIGHLRANTGLSQHFLWVGIGTMSAIFCVIAYGTIATQRGQVGEMLKALHFKLTYTLVTMGVLLGILAILHVSVFALSDPKLPGQIWNTGYYVGSAEEFTKLVTLQQIREYLIVILLALLYAYMRGFNALLVRGSVAVACATIVVLIIALLVSQVLQATPNAENNHLMMIVSACVGGGSGIFLDELFEVFAHEAGH